MLVWSYLVLSDHTVTVCDFSHKTCDSRIVMVCHFVFEVYMIQVAYEILLIFIGYYCLVFSWTVYVGATLWWTITLGYVVISLSLFFLMKTGLFRMKYYKVCQSFSHEIVFNNFLSKVYSFKIFDLNSIFTIFIYIYFSCEN